MGQSTLTLPSQVRIALSRARADLRQRGINTFVTSTVRSIREQTFLYNQFLRGNTSFPVAPPGQSNHQFGLAVDLVPEKPSDLPEVVEIMRSVGFQWAGTADSVHFDYVLPARTLKLPARASRSVSTGGVARTLTGPIPNPGAPRPPSACCCS